MNIAICDNRKEDRERLINLLEKYKAEKQCDFKIAEYESGAKLCEEPKVIKNSQIIFLDVNMEDMDSLQAAKEMKLICAQVYIVLVTASANCSLDGNQVKASRFLVKDNLEQTVEECMDDILKEIRQHDEIMHFPFVEGSVKLRADEIIYIETNRHKNMFYTQDKIYNLYKKLDEIESELKGKGFVRIHQSFLVNMRYIEKISSYVMRLTTGQELSVPKSRYPNVKKQYALFQDT